MNMKLMKKNSDFYYASLKNNFMLIILINIIKNNKMKIL